METLNNQNISNQKILLMTLPFLTPLIPPMGISCLKGYLEKHGYRIKTVDVMTEMEIRQTCYLYFDTLQAEIPEHKRGHFFNVGLDVLFNHYMAHFNAGADDRENYPRLVKLLVYHNFFVELSDEKVKELIDIVETFFSRLEQYLTALFEKEKPTVLGLSVYKGTLAASCFTAKLIKEKYPEVKVLMGGTIFSQELFPNTPNFERFLERAAYIDKIFVGESEKLFLKYLRGELPDDKMMYTLKDVDDQLMNLDTLPIPDFTDFKLSSYPLLPSYSSRGCVYRCSFCAETVYWKRYNRKSAEIVADNFEELNRKYGRNLFVLTDCLINPLATTLSNELLRRDLNIYWDVYIKVDKDVCDPQYTYLWRQAGFYRARLGIESGSQRILDIIDKKITVQQIKDAITSLASAGIKTTTYWISGHPGETEEDFQQTLDLLEELQDVLYEAECDPFRYFYTGQVNADQWSNEKGNQQLYPKEMSDMLMTQTYVLNENPSREIIYDRQCRFREHCRELGISNPYSIGELIEADRRWKRLQKNAVPPIMELNADPKQFQGESRKVNRIFTASNTQTEDVGFDF